MPPCLDDVKLQSSRDSSFWTTCFISATSLDALSIFSWVSRRASMTSIILADANEGPGIGSGSAGGCRTDVSSVQMGCDAHRCSCCRLLWILEWLALVLGSGSGSGSAGFGFGSGSGSAGGCRTDVSSVQVGCDAHRCSCWPSSWILKWLAHFHDAS